MADPLLAGILIGAIPTALLAWIIIGWLKIDLTYYKRQAESERTYARELLRIIGQRSTSETGRP